MKHLKKFNENMKYLKKYNENFLQGSTGSIQIKGVIIDDDSIDDWNNDEQIQNWIEEGRVNLSMMDSYDEYSVYAIEGDNEVIDYVKKNYKW